MLKIAHIAKGKFMYGQSQVHPTITKFLLLLDAKPQLCAVPLPAIAMELGVSVSHLQHLVRSGTGFTCTQLIRRKCVERIKAHLSLHPEETISEIAYRYGHEPRTMSRHFYAAIGSPPGALRKAKSRN